MAYCGVECQEEHWNKVHKKHCKYLAGIKKAKHSEHKRDICRTCTARNSVGDLVFSPTNPNYVCIFENVDPHPLAGPKEDRVEKMLTVAQKILLKFKITENPVYLNRRHQFDEFEKKLWELRRQLHLNRIYGGNQNPMTIMGLTAETFTLPSSEWSILTKALGYSDYKVCNGDFTLLATFALVRDLICYTAEVNLESALKSPVSLPKDYRHMSKPDQFFEVVDKIIETLDQQVVPLSHLAAIACAGETEQSCSQCNKEIEIEGIVLTNFPVRKSAMTVFNPIENERYTCEALECFKKEVELTEYSYASWTAAVMTAFRRLEKTICDCCFLLAPLKDVHRSKCLTKNYCSQICRDADDAVHKVCCDPDKERRQIEARKVKIGGHDKVEAANSKMDFFTKGLSSVTLDTALGKNIEKIIKETKKAKPTGQLATKKKTKSDEVD